MDEHDVVTGDLMLESAAEVFASRRETYGDPAEILERIAERWSLTLGTTVAPAQVALCMIDLKIVRLLSNPQHKDSIVDIAGYAACLHEVAMQDLYRHEESYDNEL